MSLQTATDKVTTGVRNLTDDVLQSAQEAVQTTRAAADQSLDKAEASVRALRRQADPAIDDLAARARTWQPAALTTAPRPARVHAARCSRPQKPPASTWPSSPASRW